MTATPARSTPFVAMKMKAESFFCAFDPLFSPILIAVAVLLFTGCGKKLEGTYVAHNKMPRFNTSAFDSASQSKLNKAMNQVDAMNTMTLEFHGSKVLMGSPVSKNELSYKIKGNELEVYSDANGQKTIIPMKINEDGSIQYLSMIFRKKE